MQKIHANHALTENGWVENVAITIDGTGRISAVDTGVAPTPGALDLVLPAPLNLHSHAFQRAMAGLTETRGPDPSDSFWTWRRLMYRFLDRLTPDHVEAIAALVFMEMLEAGYGAVAEFHYLHHAPRGTAYDDIAEMAGRIVSAAQATGIGLTLLPVLYTHGGCDRRPLSGGQLRFGNDMDRYTQLHQASRRLIETARPDDAIGVAPHSLRAVDPNGLAQVAALGTGPVHMHLAEQQAEVDEVQAHLGARPTEWLLANHHVDQRWCLIHCTQMTGGETRALAQTGAVAGLCPITESSLGDGIFNGTEFATAGGRFGVGSDSNIHIALFHELATLDYSQRLRDHSRAALAAPDRSTGRVLFDHANRAGAQAGGRASGQIAPGAWADLIGLSTDNPWLCHRTGDTALDSLIFTGRGQDCITDVWSAGRHVVQGGRHIARETITRDFLRVIAELGQDI
ncbi:formimidoylglutamate deiminase [Marimonas lutisalis]|uniref:formimidoylglutamate deiminase n=1 Tax=Marimonas lutisalis TaxID=2545756 RepID=UPI0010F6F4DD|nr:formimidoylglutamate deiminase [Marimonas lutisalis]